MNDYNLSLEDWVNEAGNNSEKSIRSCFHITLTAIAQSHHLSNQMVLKGGVLMAIKYDSHRFTTDLDFSHSEVNFNSHNEDEVKLLIGNLEKELNSSLRAASIRLPQYSMFCQVQSIKAEPNTKKHTFITASFPSLKVTIGYADKMNSNAMERLERKEAADTISIDYSFNEITENISEIHLAQTPNNLLKVYSLESLVAEKYRSILQQVVRRRFRGQDIYDIYHLIKKGELNDNDCGQKTSILHILLKKSEGKNLEEFLYNDGMKNEDVKNRAREGFQTLELKTDATFDQMYDVVERYFHNLPWSLRIKD